ncbi:MAG: radical SAM protein [Candidatus Riflemargulisbacteria bacterium]
MNYKILSFSNISLNNKGNLYLNNGSRLRPVSLEEAKKLGIDSLTANHLQHFFKTPFTSISYISGGRELERFTTHPSSFYPGSPFDVFSAVKTYLETSAVIFPRFYLYPSSACNSKCIICPFRFRHQNPFYIPLETMQGIIDYMHGQTPRPKTLSAIISGDGEPSLHPDFKKFLLYMSEKDIRMFLSSSLILPGSTAKDKINVIADTVSMLTMSIKGLSPEAYHKYQGVDSFSRVMNNMKTLVNRLNNQNRRQEALLGVATLILPENTGHYVEMVRRFVELGIDYVYLNVVEPSYKQWGITFSETLKQQTITELNALKEFNNSGTVIRFSTDIFQGTTENSVYFDANNRQNTDICGSALWNPLFMSDGKHTDMIACRSSDKFLNADFSFGKTNKGQDLSTLVSDENIKRVMANTSKCFNCRVERQVKLFDDLINIERTYDFSGEFVINFAPNVLATKGGALVFENTFRKNR